MSQPSKRRRGALIPNSAAYDECVFAALLCQDIGDAGPAKDSPEAKWGSAWMDRASPCTAMAKLELKGPEGAPDGSPAAAAPKPSAHLSSWDEDGPLCGAAERKHSQASTIIHRRGSDLGNHLGSPSPLTHRVSGAFSDVPPLDKQLPGSPGMRRWRPGHVPSPVEASAEDGDSGPDDSSQSSGYGRKRWRDVDGMDCGGGASVPDSPALEPFRCAGTPSSAGSSRAASPAGRAHLFTRGSAPNLVPGSYLKVLQSKLSKGRSRRGSTGQPVRRRQSMLTLASTGEIPWGMPDRHLRAGSTSPHSFTRELESPPFVFLGDSPQNRHAVLSQISPLRASCAGGCGDMVSNFAAYAMKANNIGLEGADRPRSNFGPGPLDTEQDPEEENGEACCVEI